MSARKPKAAPIDRSALPPVVHVSGLVVNGSNRFRLAFGRDDPVQRCVPSRPKRKGGKRDATQHNKTPFESETNKAVRARENGVRGICRGTVICPPTEIKIGCFFVTGRAGVSGRAQRPTEGEKMQHNTTRRSLNPEGNTWGGEVGDQNRLCTSRWPQISPL